MIFDDVSNLVRVLVLSVLAYPALIAILRISGKRTLAKMNAFDLVVTVALGSTLATILLSKDVSLVEGLLALLSLVALQYAIAGLSVRSAFVESLAKAEPTVLLLDGRIDDAALRRERVTHDEMKAALRGAGLGDFALAAAVVLETDGSLSVVSAEDAGSRDALPATKNQP